jgi:hypothetical protein
MVYPPATYEAGARRPAIIQLEQFKEASSKPAQYGTHHSYVLLVHTLRVAENEILKLDLPAKRH